METIYNLSHYDLDGVVCAILIKGAFKTSRIVNFQCGYGKMQMKIDEMISEIGHLKITPPLFVTDISLTQEQVNQLSQKFSKVFIMDHHEQTESLTAPANVKVVYNGKVCGAKVVFDFLKLTKKAELMTDCEPIIRLVELANDYDMWLHKEVDSYMLNELFWEMNWDKFIKNFSDGFERIPPKEAMRIKEKIKIKYNELEAMKVHKIPDSQNPDAVFCIVDKYNSIKNDITLFWKDKYKYFFIYDKDIKSIHLRIGGGADINWNNILHTIYDSAMPEYIESFGGHAYAASVVFKKWVDSNQVMETVEKIYNNI